MTEAPTIAYDPLNLTEMLQKTAVYLRRAGVAYRLKDRLVYVHNWELPSDAEPDSRLYRDDGALMAGPVTETKLHEYMLRFIRFTAKTKPKKGQPSVTADIVPPRGLAADLLASPDHWRFPLLTGLVQSPTLREDGTVLQREGYDKISGLVLDLNGVQFPAVPDRPTRDDALAALAVLKEPFSEMPFATEIDDEFAEHSPSLSVALSAVLTGMVRRTLPAAPLHGFDAAEAGSGKGLCCSVVSIICTGNRATMMNFSTNETEFRKVLFSALLANDAVITLDNIAKDDELYGETLCSALTESELRDRILGHSVMTTVPTNCLLLANGNNLTVRSDMQRRIICARIEAGENPERRTFKRPDLLAWCKDNRPRLVVAALTVLRAFEVAGRPRQAIEPFGSFEAWSTRVRSALVWLGEADPVATNARFKAADPDREGFAAVLRGLAAAYPGGRWFSAGDAARLVDGEIVQALNDVSATDATAIGKYLASNQGRTVDGMTLTRRQDTHTKSWQYRVELRG